MAIGGRKDKAALDRLEAAHTRIETRVDGISSEVNGLGSRLDARIDGLGKRMDEARADNTTEHRAVMGKLTEMTDSMREKIEQVERASVERDEDQDIKTDNLTIKVASEIGKIRGTAETVENTKKFVSSLANGQFISTYRFVIIILIVIVGIILGGHAMAHLFTQFLKLFGY